MKDPKDPLGHEKQQAVQSQPAVRLPFGVSRFYAKLAFSKDPKSDPIAAQYIPTGNEQVTRCYESTDPIGDNRYLATERLVHHYPDRALLLATDRCATYCRFCFRGHFTGHSSGHISSQQLDEACQYLCRTPRVKEILLSGGDPLMLSDRALQLVMDRLKHVDSQFIIRVCTRMPVVQPSRVTVELARMIGSFESSWLVVHANHPRELTKEFGRGIRRLLGAGVPVLSQSVLLRGVNDEVDTLEQLFRGLVRCGVKPYYLFQGDLASGTSHFRVPLKRGIELMGELRRRLSGLALPTYALDLPGAGKVPVESALLRTDEEAHVFRGPDGRGEYRYPREGECTPY
jgi:lysine 2,3-aminomutase